MLPRTSLLKMADRTLGAMVCDLLAFQRHLLRRDTRPPPPIDADIRRILVIRPGGLGDMIVLAPILQALALRYPSAVIRVVCEKRNVAVLDLLGMADAAMVYDARPFTFLRQLLTTSFDLAIDTEQFHHFSTVFSVLSGARTRIGFNINPRRNPLYTHRISYAPDGPEGHQFETLLAPLGCATGSGLTGALRAHVPTLTAHSLALMSRPPSVPLMVVHPGGSTRFKRWPVERFADATAQIVRRTGAHVLILGSAPERAAAAQLLSELAVRSVQARSLAGDLSIPQAASVLAQTRLFLGTDSGLAHLAVAVGAPTVVLFGPSDPLKWGAESAGHAIISKNIPCAPCFIFGYHVPCRNIACMDSITVPEVVSAALRVWG